MMFIMMKQNSDPSTAANRPVYSLREAACRPLTCTECGHEIAGGGPVGYRDQQPICDACMFDGSVELGMVLALIVVLASQSTPLPIIMTPQLAIGLFSVTLFMCAISAISAIVKVTKIDPATVFSR